MSAVKLPVPLLGKCDKRQPVISVRKLIAQFPKEYSRTRASFTAMRQRCSNSENGPPGKYAAIGITVCERWTGSSGFVRFLSDVGFRPLGTTLDRYPDGAGNYEPDNVRWATYEQQSQNREFCVLDVGMVAKARRLYRSGESFAAITRDFDLPDKSTGAVIDAVTGKTWLNCDELPCPRRSSQRHGRNSTNPKIISASGLSLTIPQWAEMSGIATTTIMRRIRCGWNEQKAVTQPVDQAKRQGSAHRTTRRRIES